MNQSLEHIGGAFDTEGEYHKEHYMGNRDTGRKGSSRLDVSLKHERTGRILHINTIDVKADGRTPSTREQNAAVQIMINKEDGDIVVPIPKLQRGQALSYDGLDEFLVPFIEELGRDLSEIDLNDSSPPDKQIHNFGKHGG